MMPRVWLILVLVLVSSPGLSLSDDIRKVVLQLTDGSPEKQVLVLNVADNLVAKYGDRIKIEIVAFGPGLKLMLRDNLQNDRVRQLAKQGVDFSACRSTHRKMSEMLKKEEPLNPSASLVEGGAIRILELVEQGYVLIRP
jgi:intracellular sulfur oxidation DsrE/DsrF family protein